MLVAMKASCEAILVAGLLAAGGLTAWGEDVQLRSEAVGLMNRARVVSQFKGGPYNVRTEVDFNATGPDGSLQGGSYTRVRGTGGELRQELHFGEYSASAIATGVQFGWTDGWHDPPFAAVQIREMIPFSPGAFDESDVIQQIKDGSYGGRPAVCVEFETVLGEQRLPGEACLDKANGTILELRTGSKLWEYSDYFIINGALYPAHLVYRDGPFSLTANLKMTDLDRAPEEAFAIPAEWKQGMACRQWQLPVAKAAPQPPGEGAPDAPVVDVAVHLHVDAGGRVESASVLKGVRPDLDAEAVKVAGGWIFEPGTCNGHAQGFVIDSVVHFQSWRVKTE
jgi:TonB family protein